MDLFDPTPASRSAKEPPLNGRPLAEKMRPRTFDDWVGHEAVVGPEAPLRKMLNAGTPPSMILWGPPGCGKTTLARLIAEQTKMTFQPLSAVTCGIKDVKAVIEQARYRLIQNEDDPKSRTLLFIDEIHRFNKAQQDAFLPHVETGIITLIGATTENPSFYVIAPLLSRCRTFTLTALIPQEIVRILRRACEDPRGLNGFNVDDQTLLHLAMLSDGDARRALNLLEQCMLIIGDEKLTTESIAALVERTHLLYDRSGEEHFNLISAFHKSARASDPQATLYWLTRMLAAGEDPRYLARRIIRIAVEDIGLADPQALPLATAALSAYQALGSPEGELCIVQAALYMATAPKSNSIYTAFSKAQSTVNDHVQPVPLHLRNAPTGFMKTLGYGQEYIYDHDQPDHFSGQPCLPEALEGSIFYQPGEFGFEKEIQKRLQWWEQKRKELQKK